VSGEQVFLRIIVKTALSRVQDITINLLVVFLMVLHLLLTTRMYILLLILLS